MNTYFYSCLLFIIGFLIIQSSIAMPLRDIPVTNNVIQSIVIFSFNTPPIYTFFYLHHPERLVLDLNQELNLPYRLPLNFNGHNLIKCIRTSTPISENSIRIVFELINKSQINIKIKKISSYYNLIVTIRTALPPLSNFQKQQTLLKLNTNANSNTKNLNSNINNKEKKISTKTVIVAIDAGHGGPDPGAIGPHGIKEKNVTIAIAHKLKVMLNRDPMFKPVLTRNGDEFISVMGRSEVARQHEACVLVSIHADAAPNIHARGASVLVLSNKRANSEIANLLEKNDKQAKLLGGAGNLLASGKTNPYFSQVILDLQFGNAQRVGYDIAVNILKHLREISILHKKNPEHASLGVLRSPDIPSLLVEIGFISNALEEKLLGSCAYQEKIAKALHLGLRSYCMEYDKLS